MIVLLNECKKCEEHIKMDRSIVICKRMPDYNVCVLARPSNDDKGFKNGIMVVDCKK